MRLMLSIIMLSVATAAWAAERCAYVAPGFGELRFSSGASMDVRLELVGSEPETCTLEPGDEYGGDIRCPSGGDTLEPFEGIETTDGTDSMTFLGQVWTKRCFTPA